MFYYQMKLNQLLQNIKFLHRKFSIYLSMQITVWI
jgi:hypothetical protein